MQDHPETFECFHERAFDVYERGMNATLRMKWRSISPWIVPARPGEDGMIIDEGCGTGKFLSLLARSFPKAGVMGRDISTHFLEKSREAIANLPYASVIRADIAHDNLAPSSVTTKIYSSVWHELYSYNAYNEKILRRALNTAFWELRPGGRIIIRDGVRPELERVGLWLSSQNRVLHNHGNAETFNPRSLFFKFAKDFGKIRAVPYHITETPDGKDWMFVVSQDNAYEFLMKKDYRENWEGEVKEVYGVWTAAQYRENLEAAGFQVLCVKPFRNEWIVKNRLEPEARLYRFSTHGKPVVTSFPHTNILVIGEKP